jgi:hypothetical protein
LSGCGLHEHSTRDPTANRSSGRPAESCPAAVSRPRCITSLRLAGVDSLLVLWSGTAMPSSNPSSFPSNCPGRKPPEKAVERLSAPRAHTKPTKREDVLLKTLNRPREGPDSWLHGGRCSWLANRWGRRGAVQGGGHRLFYVFVSGSLR